MPHARLRHAQVMYETLRSDLAAAL
jgi:hypothetical protein